MTRSRGLVAGVLGALLTAAMGLAVPAYAAIPSPAQVAQQLAHDPVYRADGAVDVDQGAIEQAVRAAPTPVYVVVLPAETTSGGQPLSAARALRDIGQAGDLGRDVTLAALVGSDDYAAESGGIVPDAQVESLLREAVASNGDPTAVFVDWANAVRAPLAAAVESGAASGASSGAGAGSSSGGISGGTIALIVIVALLVVAGGGYYLRRRRTRASELEGRRADVTSVYDRLGSDVSTLSPGDDAVARQALADASERYTATGALLSRADTEGEYAAARHTALEGLAAARVVRKQLGLDPGPEIKPEQSAREQLREAQEVEVGNQRYQGHPDYTPGAPYYYGGGTLGGRYVPGGWYGTPFWETLLLGGMLTGGFGGGWGFGGGGFERGYDAGYDQGLDQGLGQGADVGGGDWGGDVGDWGGGGMGDWGGDIGGDGGAGNW